MKKLIEIVRWNDQKTAARELIKVSDSYADVLNTYVKNKTLFIIETDRVKYSIPLESIHSIKETEWNQNNKQE